MNRIVACLIMVLLTAGLSYLPAQSRMINKNRRSDPALSRSYLYLAGYYRTDLKLSDRQMDSVRIYARKASRIAKKATLEVVSSYEREVLKRIMSESQYEDLFVYKNMPEARLLGEKVWNEMVSLQYVSRADSARLYSRVRAWLHTVLVARDYYAENAELRERYLEDLSVNAPACLYRLYHNGERKPPANNYYRSDFIY
jgi:hypothetical protein